MLEPSGSILLKMHKTKRDKVSRRLFWINAYLFDKWINHDPFGKSLTTTFLDKWLDRDPFNNPTSQG